MNLSNDPNQQLPTKVYMLEVGKMTKEEADKHLKDAIRRFDEERRFKSFTELA
jgi:hypothetical protein